MSTRRHEHHHYHHDGGPPESDTDWGGIFLCVAMGAIGTFIFAFWHVILAVIIGLIGIGGLGALIWKMKKHFFQLRSGLSSFRRKLAQCERRKKDLTEVEARKEKISDSDFHNAVAFANLRLIASVGQLSVTYKKITETIALMRATISETRTNVLQHAHKLSEKKLKGILDKLTQADDGLHALDDRLAAEVDKWKQATA